MEDPAHQLDSLIEDNLASTLTLNSRLKIASIDPHAPLGSNELVALAKYQLRDPEGLAFPATAPILVPAFYAASLRHLVDIAPHLRSSESLIQHNDSSHLFSDPFQDAYAALVARGAVPLLQDPPDKGRQTAAGKVQQDSFDMKARSPYHTSLGPSAWIQGLLVIPFPGSSELLRSIPGWLFSTNMVIFLAYLQSGLTTHP